MDPYRKEVLVEAFNGTAPGSPNLCGGDVCLRDSMGVASGKRSEVGCSHAEQNLMANANHRGVSMKGMWVFLTRKPCGSCEKLFLRTGVERVICV